MPNSTYNTYLPTKESNITVNCFVPLNSTKHRHDRKRQCCGTVMICCGSGPDFVLVPAPATDPAKIQHSFRTTTKFVQNLVILVFTMTEAALFPRKLASHILFLTFFITFYVESGSKSVYWIESWTETLSQKVTVPSVKVPQHYTRPCQANFNSTNILSQNRTFIGTKKHGLSW